MVLVTNLKVHDFGDCKNFGWDPPGFRKSCDGNSPYGHKHEHKNEREYDRAYEYKYEYE